MFNIGGLIFLIAVRLYTYVVFYAADPNFFEIICVE